MQDAGTHSAGKDRGKDGQLEAFPRFLPRKAEMIRDEESRLGNFSLFRIISKYLKYIVQYKYYKSM